MAATIKKIRDNPTDPVAGGYYTVREAARLLNIAQTDKIVGWLQGRKNTRTGPIINRDLIPIANIQELSFLDMMEVRFVEHFRKQGVSLQALRKAAETLREMQGQPHPFATSDAKFLTDRKNVFWGTAEELDDKILLNLVSKQYEMYVVLEGIISRGVEFDPVSGLAIEWKPRFAEFPTVVINPLISFGRPVIMPDRVPTSAIINLWKAEDGSLAAVSDWFGISEHAAKEAIEFELGLPN